MPGWLILMWNKRGRLRHLCGCLLTASIIALSLPAAAQHERSAAAWLEIMSHSLRELSYRGVFSYQQGKKMESFRIAHAVYEGEEFERLESLSGEPREIVRRGHRVTCMHPGNQLVRLYQQQGLKGEPGSEHTLIGHYYQFLVLGDGRIAGRDVVEIAVTPTDDQRLGYTMSLDRETGLLLQSTLLDPQGNIVERFQFVEIEIGMVVPRAYFNQGAQSYLAVHPESLPAAGDAEQLNWLVNWLPAGFTVTSPGKHFDGTDVLTYSDGLAVFSVFLERVEDVNSGVEGRAQKGATTAYSKAVLINNRPYRVTVVGEIPLNTAKKVAKSVTLAAL